MPLKTYTSGGLPPSGKKLVTELLQQGDAVRFSAFGPSMHPVIRSGESVLVRPVHDNDLRPGAILLFKYHGRLVLHRFIRHDRDGRLVTVADAALDGQDVAEAGDVVGTAESVRRRDRERRLDTRHACWYGLLRYHARPLRRLIARLIRHAQ